MSITDFALRFRKFGGSRTPDVLDPTEEEKKQLGASNQRDARSPPPDKENAKMSNDRGEDKKRTSDERPRSRNFKKNNEELTFNNVIQSIAVLPPMFMIVWNINPISSVILVVANIVTGILPAYESYATARLLDTVQECISNRKFDTTNLKYYGGLRLFTSILENVLR